MFPIIVIYDLNGTIIAGGEAGGKSPNQSILTDYLERYRLISPKANVAKPTCSVEPEKVSPKA